MKFMVVAALALVSISAHAITLKTCVLKNTPKNSKYTSEKTVLLANGRGNFIRAGENTRLLLSLPSVGMNADAWVNDQFMFIFKGNLSNATYESAFERGTIRCDAGAEVPFIYQSTKAGMTYAAGDLSALAGCYAGDAKAAGLDLAKMTKTSPRDVEIDRTTGTIQVTATEQQCIDGHGTNPDDYVCDKYGKVRVAYKVENCDYDPDSRP